MNGATAPNERTMTRLLQFADYLSRDISFNGDSSGLRTAAMNQGVQGATASPHLSGEGADIHVAGMSNLELAHAAKASGLFSGIGYYENSKAVGGFGAHTHVDTKSRATSGVTTWTIDSKKNKTAGLPAKPE
jgi:hypothetical protein